MKTSYTLKLLAMMLVSVKIYAQVTYSFTSAGSTGRFGPSQVQLNTAYANSNLNGLVTSVNGIQQFTVPVAGNYRIEARGAQGGSITGGSIGGQGSTMIGEFFLNANSVVRIVVGQQGIGAANGACGGGGGSYVVDFGNAPYTNNAGILVVAGGGGGGGRYGGGGGAGGYPGGRDNYGLGGGLAVGVYLQNTAFGMGGQSGGRGGQGASQSSSIAAPSKGIDYTGGGGGGGGSGAIGADGGHGIVIVRYQAPTKCAMFLQSGVWQAPAGVTRARVLVVAGGGGGGGYSGGGGGHYYGNGGGGGSYNNGTSQSNTSGARSNAHGQVIITFVS